MHNFTYIYLSFPYVPFPPYIFPFLLSYLPSSSFLPFSPFCPPTFPSFLLWFLFLSLLPSSYVMSYSSPLFFPFSLLLIVKRRPLSHECHISEYKKFINKCLVWTKTTSKQQWLTQFMEVLYDGQGYTPVKNITSVLFMHYENMTY